MIVQEFEDASIALTAWCQSQDITPFDCVMLLEYTMARMIVENMTSPEDMEAKLKLCDDTIRSFIQFIKVHAK